MTVDPVQHLLNALHAAPEGSLPPEVQAALDQCEGELRSPLATFSSAVGAMIDERDRKILELEEKVSTLEYRMKTSKTGWCLPRDIEKSDLPVPRLEMRIEQLDSHNWAWTYMLVYSHFSDGHLEGVVISQTTTSGGRGPVRDDHLELPFRDGVHIRYDARALDLPAFITYETRVERLEPMDRARYEARRTEHLKTP